MMKYTLLFALLFITSISQASQVGFNSTNSDDLYVCNVSLTTAPTENSIGKIMGSLTYEDLTKNATSPWRVVSGGFSLSESSLSPFDDQAQWSAKITDLKLAFTTEQMGVGYKVHVCYLGPVANKKGKNDLTEKEYSVIASVYHSMTNYAKMANLYYRITTACDLRNRQSDARKANETSPSSELTDYYYVTNWAPFDGTLKETSLVLNSRSPQQVPRFCEITYEFKEASADLRPNELYMTEVNLSVDVL